MGPVTLDTAGMQEMAGAGTQADRRYFTDPSTGAVIALHILGGALTEPYWLDDLDLARRHLAREYASIGCLIEANSVAAGGVRGMAQLWKRPTPGQAHGLTFGVSVFLAKITQTANIVYYMDERRLGITGLREAVVMDQLQVPLHPEPHPYDPELRGLVPFSRADDEVWDEQFPEHPLTCVRAWLRTLDRVVTVNPVFAALPDFRGTAGRPRRR